MVAASKIPQNAAAPTERRWTYAEFEYLGTLGFFKRQRVELLRGKIIQMAPQLDLHAAALGLAQRAVEHAFNGEFWIRPQLPLQIGKWSGPEPDLAVVPGGPRDYLGTGHPKTALLVLEISDSTVRLDRTTKAAIYAKAEIADYWIVNLVERQLEIHRQPVADSGARLGYHYAQITILTPPATIAPLAMSNSQVSLVDLLP